MGGSQSLEQVGGSQSLEQVVGSQSLEQVGGSQPLEQVVGSQSLEQVVGSQALEQVVGSQALEQVVPSHLCHVLLFLLYSNDYFPFCSGGGWVLSKSVSAWEGIAIYSPIINGMCVNIAAIHSHSAYCCVVCLRLGYE